MKMLIAGDLVPTASNIEAFENNQLEALLQDGLLDYWFDADCRVFNLEAPLTDQFYPIGKCGPNLSAPTATIKGIVALKPTLISMANNHILDHGEKGLESTLNLLSQYKVPWVGVGSNLVQASAAYIIEHSGHKIGIYSCSDIEFSVATELTPGANPFDPLESLDHLVALKKQTDYVIVLYHAGKEHYRYPSPALRKICNKMVQKGANCVFVQHSHCIGSYEVYQGSHIVYGLGNFIFSKNSNEFWNNGLLVQLTITDSLNVEFVPFIKTHTGARLAKGSERETLLNDFFNRSKQILVPGFIEQEYDAYATKHLNGYLRTLRNANRILSKLDRLWFNNAMLKYLFPPKQLYSIQNYIECEAHRELLIRGLKIKGKR